MSTSATCRYHSHLALISFFSDDRAIRFGRPRDWSLGKNIAADFERVCASYRDKLESNFGAYLKTSRRRSNSRVQYPEFLYNPFYSIALGAADGVGVALLDDWDPYLKFTGETDLPMDRALLCFEPDLQSLGIQDRESRAFTDLPALLSDTSYTDQSINSAIQGLDTCYPLRVFTRYETSGLASLKCGIDFQRAIFRAFVRRTNKAIAQLQRLGQNEELYDSLELSADDIRDTRVVLLDSQSSEDIVSIILTNNYSIAFTIISAIRSLCFNDLLSDNDSIVCGISDTLLKPDAGRNAVLYEQLQRLASEEVDAFESIEDIAGNHLFATTHSTAAVSIPAFYRTSKDATNIERTVKFCRGNVEVYSRLDIAPGHISDLTEKVKATLEECPANDVNDGGNCDDHVQRILVGRHDYDFALTDKTARLTYPRLPIDHVLQRLNTLVEKISSTADPFTKRGTGLLGSSTWLVVPIPIIDSSFSDSRWPLPSMLNDLQKHMFGAHDRNGDESNPLMCIATLSQIMRKIRLPRSMRRSIEYLYQNYAESMRDPFLFDSVLDLYDTFKALYQLLCHEIPLSINPPQTRVICDGHQTTIVTHGHRAEVDAVDVKQVGELGNSSIYVGQHATRVNELPGPGQSLLIDQLDMLSDIIDALHNALSHRINLQPRSESRDWATDFRGGLNRLVAAADAPCKCGIGLLKWCKNTRLGEDSRELTDSKNNRSSVSAVTRFSFLPQAACQHINLIPNQLSSISLLDLNVTHIFHPTEFYAYLHEAAHEVFEWLHSCPEYESILPLRDERYGRQNLLREQELFAEMLTSLFVFHNDWRLYLKFHICQYSNHPVSVGAGSESTAQLFCEIALRSFYVTSAIRHSGKASSIPLLHPWRNLGLENHREELRDEFLGYLKEIGPFFADYDELETQPFFENLILERFDGTFAKIAGSTQMLWEAAAQIYRSFSNASYPWHLPEGRSMLSEAIRECLDQGESGVERVFESKFSSTSEESSDIDNLSLVCQMIGEYVRFCYGELSSDDWIHLYRNESGVVDYLRGEKRSESERSLRWNPMQLDRGYPHLYCCDPIVRKDRLKREIVILKSLWNMSTRLRARRLSQILCEVLPT